MPKCPICGEEVHHLLVSESVHSVHEYKVYPDGRWVWQHSKEGDKVYKAFCPECGEEIPLDEYFGDIEDFLEENYIILRSDDPEIKRKENFVLFRGKVYKVMDECSALLHLKLVEDETIASIIRANLE